MSRTPKYLVDAVLAKIPTDRYVRASEVADALNMHPIRVGKIVEHSLLSQVDRRKPELVWWYRKRVGA